MATKERAFDPQRLDLPLFCRQAAQLQGEWPQAGFTRLLDSLHALPGDRVPPPVQWRALGTARPVTGGEPELWLQLQAQTEVALQCQRCLQPSIETLAVDRRLRFVRGEDEAARLDEDSEDDVLALQARTDLHELLEDELILALPLVPMHAQCPQPLLVEPAPADPAVGAAGAAAEPDRPHPFAALSALRKPPQD
jgi:uncharacterized protein